MSRASSCPGIDPADSQERRARFGGLFLGWPQLQLGTSAAYDWMVSQQIQQRKGGRMGLPRAFVGFSSTDMHCYRLMQAWKAHEHMEFNFTDCQLEQQIYSESEAYIKRTCGERIGMAGTYIMLIGEDTKWKYRYVRWEAEVALEKDCRIIGVNLDHSRQMVAKTCPPVIRDVGALFVSFSPRIVARALEYTKKGDPGKNYYYPDGVYAELGIEPRHTP